MKSIVENVIKNGGYDLGKVISKIDILFVEGKLTNEEREELIAKARNGASAEHSTDFFKKIEELDERVRKLESGNYVTDDEECPDYIVGKWYYKGDKITFEGECYVCDAPDGVVCTWSPFEYPAYWKLVE